MTGIDSIRVPLLCGVRFVASLLLREEAAFPELVLVPDIVSENPDSPFVKWERAARCWGENQIATAQDQDKIPIFATAAMAKNILDCDGPDIYPPERFAPSFQNSWV
jgi:hypothetical protein